MKLCRKNRNIENVPIYGSIYKKIETYRNIKKIKKTFQTYLIRYCLKGFSFQNYENNSSCFPDGGSKKRKPNSDGKHDRDQQKKRP